MEEAAAAFDSESSRMLQVRPLCHTLKCNSKPRLIFSQRVFDETRRADAGDFRNSQTPNLKPQTPNVYNQRKGV